MLKKQNFTHPKAAKFATLTPPTVSGPKFRKILQLRCFFSRTSLSNRNIVLAILLLAGDVYPNPGPINRETIYPCGYCQQHVRWFSSGVGCETCNVWYHRECVSITHSHYLAHVWICFKYQTPNFSNSSISITGSPEILQILLLFCQTSRVRMMSS